MKTQQHMGIIWTIYFIIVIILLGSSASVSSDEGKKTEEVLLSQLVDDPTSGEIDSYMAEILWLNCKTDLIKLKEVTEEFDLCLAEKTSCVTNKINVKWWSMGKENIHKIISLLHPEVKQNLLDCLRKNNMLFRVFGEESGSKVWYARYAEYIFPKAASRRNLGTKSLRWVTKVSAPAQSNNNAVIIAVVATACVTFIMAALLFLCCSRFFGGGSKMGRNDENPLLSLSMSDFSVGSFARGNSIKEEKVGRQSFGNNSSHHRKASSLDGDFNTEFDGPRASLNGTHIGDMSTDSNAQVLPPPAGVTTSIGLPPLKPPPGKARPLPLEPRSSFEAPPSKTSPPLPPPPPAPFSCTKPFSIASPFSSGPPPPPPPIASGNIPGPCPPPPRPPLGGVPAHLPPPGSVPAPRPPPAAPIGSKFGRAPPPAPRHPSNGSRGAGDGPKTKLKPFFWDKVLANPDQTMVWHQLKAGSFQFDENMIESLFGCAATDKNKNEKKKEKAPEAQPQFIQIIDSKKSQNLSILLRALNVTIEEVCDALEEGNELPSEFLQTLLKMAPTPEEELKFRMFNGQLSQLGPADRFLKALVDIPFAFKRLEALLFMCTVQEEIAATEESFATLEIACKELRNSRLFLKLLEAVLKTGNRMNDGTFRGGAQAFKLDTLLKLSDVKGTDGKTTLLHFVVLEIIRSEGVRAARMAKENKSFSSIKTEDLLQDTLHETDEHYRSLGLEVVSQLGNDLENIKKAANLDADCLVGTVAKISHGLQKNKEFLNFDMKNVEEDNGFHQALKSFVEDAEGDIIQLLVEEKRIMALVKSTGDYFHGNAGKDEGLRLFNVVRDFLLMLERACREVREAQKKQTKTQ